MFSSSVKNWGRLRQAVRSPAVFMLAALLVCFQLPRLVIVAMAADPVSEPPWAEASPAGTSGQEAVSYQLVFQGNAFFSERQLQETAAAELADFERLGHRKAEADDAAFQMELAYKKAGFAFAVVDYQYEFKGDRQRLTFLISEGPRVRVNEVVISGNSFFDLVLLQKFFRPEQPGFTGANGKPFYVESAVRSAIGDIRDLYYGEGYLDVRIEEPRSEFTTDRNGVILFVAIREGPRYLIRGLEFSGDVLPEATEELHRIAAELEGKPYYKRRNLLIRSRVLEIYGDLGYPDVQVEIREKTGEQAPGDVILEAVIHSGPQVSIGGISITGCTKTKDAFIESRLQLRPGDLYSLAKKRQSFQALYKTGLFSSIDIKLAPASKPAERILVVEVTEAPSRELSVEAGWGSYELLRLGLGFRNKNFLGTGRIVRTEGKYSLKGESVVVGITDPWFLGTDIVADLPFSFQRREEPSFTRQETGTSLLFSKKMSPALLVTLGYSFRLTSISKVDVNTVLENTDTGYNMASIKAQATWDTRNDPFFPTTGYKNFIAAETADAILGSEVDLARFTAGSRYFLPLTPAVTLGLRYNTGFALPGRNEVTLPLGERFYNGGENTVRSFRESRLGPLDLKGEPVGGMAFNIINIELRRRLGEKFALSLFGDCGNVSPNRSRAEEGQPAFTDRSQVIETTAREYFRDFRYAVGIGLQYLLPVGPIRLDFALNPDYREWRHEDRYNIHFSMGMAF